MMFRVAMKTVFPMIAMGVISALLSGSAYASGGWGHGGCGNTDGGGGGGGGGGSVPEIGAGSATAAVSLVVGGFYILKDRFLGKKSDQATE
jgi:hypothetical protein